MRRFRRRMSAIATYIDSKFIPTPHSIGSQARAAMHFAMPTGSATAKAAIHAFRRQIPREIRLRVLGSLTGIVGSAIKKLLFDVRTITCNSTNMANQATIPIAHSRGDSLS